jgi:uncharacterized membrane protein YedE/YeeE
MINDRFWLHGLLGVFFGVLLVKAEVLSWYRIQEMFRFDSFHMYGVIGTAVGVGWLGLRLLGRPPVKEKPTSQHLFGGTLFGLGWGLTGACPGPMYALVGYGVSPYIVALASAILGTWVYGWLRQTPLAARPLTSRLLNLT